MTGPALAGGASGPMGLESMRLRLEEDGIVALFTGQIPHGGETGDPELLRRHMTRLSWVTYRIVWASPRT